MKFKRLSVVLAGLIVVIVAALIIRSREPYLFEEVSRFARLGPEEHLSEAEVQEILQQSTPGPIVITALQNDTSEALESIPMIEPRQSRPDPDLNELRPLPKREGGGAVNPPGKFQDPVLQESPGLASTLNISTPLQNFDGLNNVNGVLPPDTNGDVGPNHYMQWVNLSFAIYSKSGALLYGPAAGNTLWSGFGGPCQTTNDGDPIVQYDHLADRWMVSQFSLPNYPSGPFYQCIAVSQTGNPTGAWYRYAFQISATKINDYPHFGVWPDGYYMSVNQFVGNTWAGAGVVAFERDKMLLGQPAQAVYFDLFAVDPNLGGMLPSDLDGPAPAAGTPNYFLQVDDNGFGYPQDQIELWQFSVNWANPAASTFTQAALLPTAAFDSDMCAGNRSCIPQQGTSIKLDAIADRLMYRLQYRNFGGYQTMVLNHTVDVNNTDRAGIRWYELRNSGAGWNIFQQGTFSPDATQRWMGSAAMDGLGNIALGYSASSSTIFPAIRYTGRLAGDPLGQLPQGEGTIINGTGAQTHTASRWGDYSSLSVDPVDNCTFWYTNEYVQTTGSAPWRTRIGSFQLPGCGVSVPTATPTNTSVPVTPSNTPVSAQNPLYLSFTSSQTIGGVASADEDILRFDGTNWSLFFDGSDVGVATPDLFAFSIVNANTILMSFNANVTVNGVTATPQDVLRFTATSLGGTTAGTFSMYFDGSDVGFDTTSEKIDSLSILPDGRLLISTTGSPSVPGLTTGKDEDVLAFTPTALGNTTSGTWSLYFDGSDVGLSETSGEDVDALDVVGSNIYLSTLDAFSVTGLSGADEDVFVCAATSLGDVTACNYSPTLYFDGSSWGLSANDVDAFNFLSTGPVPTAAPANTSTNTPLPGATQTRTPTATSTSASAATNTPTRTPTPLVTPTRTPTRTPGAGSLTYSSQPDGATGVDAYLQNSTATTNFGTDVAIGVGENNNATSRVARGLIKFDLSSIPSNATIVSATLSLWTASDLSDTDRALHVYRLKVPFDEAQATWNTSAAGVNWQVAGASGANDRESTDIGSVLILANEPLSLQKQIALSPASIQELVSGAFANNGFVIAVDTELNDRFNYKSSDTTTASNRPMLVIQYTVP